MKKIGTIRQLSLQCDVSQRRRTLQKQLSEDVPDQWPQQNVPRASSAKARPKTADRPGPLKIAWSDNLQKTLEEQLVKRDEGLVAKKCKEIRRPATAKLTKQQSLDKDSVLYSRQELAEKLRQAWNDKEKNKQNLNIFLTPSTKQEEDQSDLVEPESIIIEKPKPPPLSPTSPPESPLADNKDNVLKENYRNIFQKQIRKSQSFCSEFAYTPSKSNENTSRSNTIVVVPVPDGKITNKQQIKSARDEKTISSRHENNDNIKNNSVKPINNVVIRPSTAASRREGFQKRVNSAFHESVKKESPAPFRPPLVRSTSVPVRPEPKPKFLASKRRVKTAKKREKICSEEYVGSDNESESGKSKNKRVLQRCITLSNGEVETMVSLISPEESESEEFDEKKEPDPPSEKEETSVKKDEQDKDNSKNFSLRKTVKSVSFQQSSIHAVRSFSASFPARRGSIAAALLLAREGPSKMTTAKTQEKRNTPVSTADDEEKVPKRRLIRTKSAPLGISVNEALEDGDDQTEQQIEDENEAISVSVQRKPDDKENKDVKEKNADPTTTTPTQACENESTEPEFNSPKEKQCWELYCKMSGKGVNVSFDTILRGMLTPTEYRMRKKPSVEEEVEAPNC